MREMPVARQRPGSAAPAVGGSVAATSITASRSCSRCFTTEEHRRVRRSRGHMSSRDKSLSMFVVQRTFSRVRRGYDPQEVDRHLELVSQWFTTTDAGKAIADERAKL